MALDVSDDSQMIASGSADKNVRLWSTQFGNCLKSLKAHEESVMQVKFLPGTHYLATAGRDHKLKLWDCDSYELITALPGHACEILAMALSQDAAFIVTAGSDKQIRIWRRTQEQLFLSEERAKELEEQFEQEVEREAKYLGQEMKPLTSATFPELPHGCYEDELGQLYTPHPGRGFGTRSRRSGAAADAAERGKCTRPGA
ncbi:Wdr3 [Symbiodinium microadriaticum]|nr:Wdr3 [Symbiodinium microadriaticum]